MRSSTQVGNDLTALEALPYAEQVAGLEGLLPEADALGDEELAADVRGALISATEYSELPRARMLSSFAWLLQRFDDRPGWWGERHDYKVLWTYKWMVSLCIDDPSVALSTLNGLVAGMEERYRRRGLEAAPVLHADFKLTQHLLGAEAAADAFARWVTAPRTDFSDCRACEPSDRLAYLASVDNHADALADFWPVHDGEASCIEQPQSMYAAAVPSLLLEGHGDVAVIAHLRGTRASHGVRHELKLDAPHIGHCARAGQLGRALELYTARIGQLATARDEWERMTLAAHSAVLMSRLLAAGRDDLGVASPSGDVVGVAEAHATLVSLATERAAAFDERNQTTAESARLSRILEADDLPPLDLGAAAPSLPSRSTRTSTSPDSPGASTTATATATATVTNDPAPLPADLGVVWEALDHALLYEGPEAAPRVAARWVEVRDEVLDGLGDDPSPLQVRRVADLDTSRFRHLPGDPTLSPAERVLPIAAEVAALLREQGWEAEALLAEQAASLRVLELGAKESAATSPTGEPTGEPADEPADEVMAQLEDLRRRVSEGVALVDAALADPGTGATSGEASVGELRARARSRARTVSPDREERDRLVAECLDLTRGVDPSAPADSRWSRAIALAHAAEDAEPDVATTRLREVLALLSDGLLPTVRAGALLMLADAAAALDRPDEALDHAETSWEVAEPAFGAPGAALGGVQHLARLASALPDTHVPRAVALMVRQLAAAEAVEHDELETTVIRYHLAPLLARAGRLVEATETLERALSALGDPAAHAQHPQFRAFVVRAHLLQLTADYSARLGETTRAERLADRAVDAATEAGEDEMAAHAARLHARVVSRGEDSLATLAAHRRAVRLTEPLAEGGQWGLLGELHVSRRAVAEILLEVDGRDAAEAALDDATRRADELAASVAAGAHPAAGDPELRRHLADHHAWESVRLRQSRAGVRSDAGDLTGADELLRGLPEAWVAIDVWPNAVLALGQHARVRAGLDDLEGAERLWERACTEARTHELPDLGMRCLQGWAVWLDEHGHAERAQAVWDHWRPVFEPD